MTGPIGVAWSDGPYRRMSISSRFDHPLGVVHDASRRATGWAAAVAAVSRAGGQRNGSQASSTGIVCRVNSSSNVSASVWHADSAPVRLPQWANAL